MKLQNFDKMNIDTQAVLDAAKSKWNFIPFKPGLVGGHCIGVDPYYLTFKAKNIGYHPKIILAGRKLNDKMGKYVVIKLTKKMKKKNIKVKGAKVLIMGLTFKENCPDLRNSGVQSVIKELKHLKCSIDLYDPWANEDEIMELYKISPKKKLNNNTYDTVLIAVAHNKFKKIGINKIKSLCKNNHVIFDLKNLFKSKNVDLKL